MKRGGGGVKQIFSWYIWVTSWIPLTFLTCLQTQVCGECHQWTRKLFSWHRFQRFPQTPDYKLLLQTHVFSALSLFYLTCTTALFPETSRTWPALGYGDLYLWWSEKQPAFKQWFTCECHQAVWDWRSQQILGTWHRPGWLAVHWPQKLSCMWPWAGHCSPWW